jgi:hypothetical protein
VVNGLPAGHRSRDQNSGTENKTTAAQPHRRRIAGHDKRNKKGVTGVEHSQ